MSRNKRREKREERKRLFNKIKKCCLGKIQHKYRTSAEYVLEQMKGDDLNIYRCKYCDFLHIGNTTEKEIND